MENKNLLIHKIKQIVMDLDNKTYLFGKNVVLDLYLYGEKTPTTLNKLVIKKGVLYLDCTDAYNNNFDKLSEFDVDEISDIYGLISQMA